MASARYQLGMLFEDIDHKAQRLRELRANVKTETEAEPDFRNLTDQKSKIGERFKELKDRVRARMGGDVQEISQINKELKIERVRFRDMAVPLLISGKELTVKAGLRELDVQLDVRLVPKDVAPETDEKSEARKSAVKKRAKAMA